LIAKFKISSVGDTNETIKNQIEAIKKENELTESKIKPYVDSGAKLITAEELNNNMNTLKKGREEWKKRRKGAE
jgi:uncharacterized protein YqgV (UPF0045/DUF77 family)